MHSPPPKKILTTEKIRSRGILRALGIVGWDLQEPVILAALATRSPLVLIGKHGTAKSLLLERLAEALELQYRHYNASIINFDDLIGFPVPKDGSIEYLRTPLDAWDAQAIFIDEISRCRIDMQNRLFPIVHERKLQGKDLEHLEYCWSAMNPSTKDYVGTYNLDVAFADRYHWLIRVPETMSMKDELAIIEGINPISGAGKKLQQIIREIRGTLHTVRAAFKPIVSELVQTVRGILENAGFSFSLRRAHIIYQNIIALLATGRFTEVSKATHTAICNALTQNTSAAPPQNAITKALRMSREYLTYKMDPILKELLKEKDILKRIQICLRSKNQELITATILDAHASLAPGERIALSYRLFPILVERYPDLPTLIFENLSFDMEKVQSLKRSVELLPTYSNRYKLVDKIAQVTSTFHEHEAWIEDVIWAIFQDDQLHSITDIVEYARHIQSIFPQEYSYA